MIAFSNLKNMKAAVIIAQQVRDAVLSGKLTVGDRLPPEKDLIAQFGYSRAVVREGLRLLEAEGLVVLQAGRNGGAVVHNPNPERLGVNLDLILRLQRTTVREVHDAQRLIEPLIIQQAIKHATVADLARVRATITLIEQNPDNVDLVREQSNRFHSLLAECTHNNVLAIIGGLIRQIVLGMRYTGTREEALVIARAHRRILQAVEARDEAAAVRRVMRHINATECVLGAEPTPTTCC
jgi:GntR family transcriptional regulator, transcriptional repressor for pyruvate dehydrogenase complex